MSTIFQRVRLGAACLMAAATAAVAQEVKPDPAAIIAAQALPIERTAEGFAGPGWQALVELTADAQFAMIGEQHGSASIAELEVSLQAELYRRGTTHTAFEIGPLSTREVERMLRADPDLLAKYLAQPGLGFTVPFLFVREELPLAQQAVALSPDGEAALWGLDQEFVGAMPLLADLLKRNARTPAQHAAVEALGPKALADPFHFTSMPDSELDALAATFAEDDTAQEIFRQMRESRAIYAPFMTGKGSVYLANLARETMMKRNLQAAFEDAEKRTRKPPKVFFKFGGYHAMRGISGTDVPALGNFVAEWGSARGFQMANVLVDCLGGEMLNPQTSAPTPCESYIDGATALLAAAQSGPEIQVIDLKALRPQLNKMKELDAKSRQTILAFDMYVAIKGGKAATPVGAFPKP